MTTVSTVPVSVPVDAAGLPQLTDALVSATLESMAKRREEPVPPARAAARALVAQMAGEGWLEELMARTGKSGVELTGSGGFLREMIKAV